MNAGLPPELQVHVRLDWSGRWGCCGWRRAWVASRSVVEAEAILSGAVDAYRAALGERLVAAYALGSLAHGGFSALVSDIDLALILADPVQPDDGDAIRAIAETQKRAGSGLAQRLSVFWGTPLTLRGQADGGRFPPLDRLDLIANGRLLAGVDVCSGLPRPTAEELLISGAEFALDFLAGVRAAFTPTAAGLGSMRPASQEVIEEIREPELLLARGVRRVTKLVLFPVRFMFTAATGRVGTNDEAVAWYVGAEDAPCKPLVGAALAWREAPPEDDSTALQLLREQLLPLYVQYIDDHIARLAAVGRPDLAGDFTEWRARLSANDPISEAVEIILDAFASRRLIPLLSDGHDTLDEDTAYEISDRIYRRRRQRGETPVGRKIGFTNRTIWPQYSVWAPIWGYVYDSTVFNSNDGTARVAIGHLIQPRIEPEIQLHFARTPPVSQDEAAILESIDWIAQGFEIVQCPFAGWKFNAVDAIAAYAVHGALVIGTPVPVADIEDCAAKLRTFTVALARDGECVATGGGANVLDSPLLAFAHLTEVLARQPRAPPVRAGEVVTTGTLTDLLPAAPGETWSTELASIELPGLTLGLV